jgi:GT2 family glycosyltransferase
MAAQDRGLPSVAILTINYNSRRHLEEFLTSLRAVAYPNYRLVAVDNASSDGSPEEIRWLFPEAVLLRNGENLGVSGGHNVGIRYCLEQGFDYILFLNNDTVVSQDFLDRLVESADERTLVAPKTYLYGQPGLLDDTVGDFDWRRGVWRGWLYGKPEPPGFERPREVSMASLCCLPLSSATWASWTSASSCTTRISTSWRGPRRRAIACASIRRRSSTTVRQPPAAVWNRRSRSTTPAAIASTS